MKLIDRLILFVLAAIFLFSGIDKAFHYEGFVNAVRDYVLVPPGGAPYLALPVILAEILTGIGLLLPAWRRPAATSAVLLLVTFTAALGLNHVYGNRGVCGCWFTITLAKSSGHHIAQNLLLALLAAMTWHSSGRLQDRKPSLWASINDSAEQARLGKENAV